MESVVQVTKVTFHWMTYHSRTIVVHHHVSEKEMERLLRLRFSWDYEGKLIRG